MTYEYVCTSCGHAWEAEQSISAAPLTVCPNCDKASAKRQISGGAGFILRGGGWYADGYGSAKKEAPASKDGASTKESIKESTKESTAEGGTAAAAAKKPAKPDSGSGSSSDGGSKPAPGTSDGGGAAKGTAASA